MVRKTPKKRSTRYKAKRSYKRSMKRRHKRLQVLAYTPKCPMPERIRTRFTCALQGVTASAVSFQRYMAYFNNPTLPFSNATNPWPNPDNPVGSLNPTYWTYLYTAAAYQSYRVISSTFKLTMKASDIIDNLWVAVLPVPNIANYPSSYQVAEAQPNCRTTLFDAYNKTSLKHSMKYHDLLGCSEAAIINDLSGEFSGLQRNPPLTTSGWYVVWETATGTTVSETLGYDVEISWYVELWNLNYGSLSET